MTEQYLRQVLLKRYDLRVKPETLQYVMDALRNAPASEPIIVIGASARTGVARRESIRAADLTEMPDDR